MRLPVRMVVVLSAVSLLAAAFLAGVNILTRERIAFNKQKEIEAAISLVIPGSSSSRKVYEERGLSVYAGADESGSLIGWAVESVASGFQDNIVFLIGADAGLSRIRRLYILEQKETPGLGAKITDEKTFLQFWEGKNMNLPLALRKPPAGKEELGPSEVNTVTGATISSEAVLNGVSLSLDKLKKLRSEGKLEVERSHAK
jgi:electron transport complex protein RnfG